MDMMIQYQWELFIGLEVVSWLSLLSFLLVRYALKRQRLSMLCLLLFLTVTLLEGVLALIVYKETGVIDTLQIIIMLFLLYACTFGISDFKKLDRWMKQKVGNWQGVDLLTEKDRQAMEREQNPRWMARSYRRWWYGHTLLFIVAHSFFWLYFGNDDRLLGEVLTDWSWLENMDLDKIPENGPYRVASIYPVSLIWGIVYIADTINAWYYTLFPGQEKRNRMYK
ncbi:MAG TPA: hypothetical protein VK119_12280 [Bacillota bacterium]|nr:hypothetical protein [Bacillota bacterium]